LRKTGGAVPLLSAAQSRFPQDFWLNFELGFALFMAQRRDEALGYYRAALALRPEGAEVHANLGMVLSHQEGRLDEAIRHYQEALRLDPKLAAAHTWLGLALHDKDELAKAIAQFEEAIRLDPQGAAEAHCYFANTMRKMGRLDEAIGHYEEALRLDPKAAGPSAHFNIGAILRDEGRLDEAIDHLQEVIRLDPKTSANAHLQIARALRDKGRFDEAIGHIQEANRLDPKASANAHSQLALTHVSHRQWAQAADCYARILKVGPTDEGHFWFEYAALLLLSGDRPGYARACAHMIDKYGKPDGPRAYHVARACTLAEAAVAEPSLPARLAEKELKDSAGAFWSLTERGALAYRAGQHQEALPFFEKGLEAESKPGRAVVTWLWLALAHQRLGKSVEARRWLDKAAAWLDQYRDGMPARAEEDLGLHLHNWLEAHVLRREAEALIQPAGPR
jgi:tetratricopeptide (TPR) repeat protein